MLLRLIISIMNLFFMLAQTIISFVCFVFNTIDKHEVIRLTPKLSITYKEIQPSMLVLWCRMTRLLITDVITCYATRSARI